MLYSTKIATFHNSCNVNIAQRASYCKAHIAYRQRNKMGLLLDDGKALSDDELEGFEGGVAVEILFGLG